MTWWPSVVRDKEALRVRRLTVEAPREETLGTDLYLTCADFICILRM